ncbi:Hypothetical protein A7982_02894 [Minicystis rosea]|nr:Hypothetical protein A7982_02894 [Minicystis rosea]
MTVQASANLSSLNTGEFRPFRLIVSVTDANGLPRTGLAQPNFTVQIGPGDAAVYPPAVPTTIKVSPLNIPGLYLLSVMPKARWQAVPYTLFVSVSDGQARGQAIVDAGKPTDLARLDASAAVVPYLFNTYTLSPGNSASHRDPTTGFKLFVSLSDAEGTLIQSARDTRVIWDVDVRTSIMRTAPPVHVPSYDDLVSLTPTKLEITLSPRGFYEMDVRVMDADLRSVAAFILSATVKTFRGFASTLERRAQAFCMLPLSSLVWPPASS